MTRAEWYRANAEKLKAKARENYAKNKMQRKKTAKAWAQANKDKVQAANKRWEENNPKKYSEIRRRQGLRRSTGGAWTLEQYEEVFAQQGGRCAICDLTTNRSMDADHDHNTGERRELLCNACNMLLGYAKDSPLVLEKAAAYLRKWGKF